MGGCGKIRRTNGVFMTCKEVIDFLGDYLDGALPWRQRLVFNLHLVLCRHCRRYLASYSETIRLTRASGREPSPEAQPVPEELLQAILATRRAGHGPSTGGDLQT